MKDADRSTERTFGSPFLDNIWKTSTGAVVLCESGGRVIASNSSFDRLFGYPPDTVPGRELDALVTPSPWISESDAISGMALSGIHVALNTVRMNADGNLLQVFLTVSSVHCAGGAKGLLFILRPIPGETRKRASDRLENGMSMAVAFENSMEPSVITDAGGIIEKTNPAFSSEFGFSSGSLEGVDVRRFLIPAAIEPEADYVNAMMKAGRILRLQTSRLREDGSVTPVSLICSPAADGSVYRIYRTPDSSAITEDWIMKRNRFRGCPAPGRMNGMLFQCRTDRGRTMEFIAPGSAGFTGYTEEKLLSGEVRYGAEILDLDRDMVLRTIQDSLVSGEEYSITYRIRNSAGSVIWVMEQGRAFKADRDSVDFCEGCIVHITGTVDRDLQEDDARERIERLHTVAGELQRSRSAGEIYRICAEAGLSILSGACSCVFIRTGGEMKIVASAGRDEFDCQGQCNLEMAQVAMNTSGPCYFRSRDTSEGFCPAGTSGVCFKLGNNAVFQIMSRSSRIFGNIDTRIIELLLGYTEQGLKRITLQHQLINQALHDPLTGIYNRNYFNRLIQLEEHRARRLDSAISFIMVDVDNFKHINDRYGHQAGDRVLQQVAGILEGALRKTDTVLRYGGDEFLIILTRMTDDYTHIVEKRIRESLHRLEALPALEGERISVSMGHAFWTPDGTESIDEVLKVADMIMLRNKKEKP